MISKDTAIAIATICGATPTDYGLKVIPVPLRRLSPS